MNSIVSVCIPTYNGAKYFRECLDSILAQTFTNFELLIVDDHSSDETLEIAQDYATKDSRIRVTKNERNLGLVGNWNRCIELAQGEWIKFVFQDDLIAPTCLEKMLSACDPDSGIVFCRRDFIFEEGTSRKTIDIYTNRLRSERFISLKKTISAEEYCRAALKHMVINFVGEPTVVMVRRDAFQRFGSFNPHIVQICDLELWTRVASNLGITYVSETLATFRVHSGATTATNHTSREYRMRLDGIILKHDLLFHPAYENLRAFNSRQWLPVNLLRAIKQDAYLTWIIASRADNNQTEQSQKIVREWQAILKLYPFLGVVAKLGNLEKAYYLFERRRIHWKWQITQFFEAQFQS